MRNRILWLLSSCVLLILVAAAFNRGEELSAAPMPEPSVWGGYYEEGFTLKLTAPQNGTIYYTTDGSAPSKNSTPYVSGIRISDRSDEPNIYNSIQNVVRNWYSFTPNNTPVPKGTVIRAIFINELGIQSDILTQSYFVGLQPPERGYTLSLVFEYEDLFGDNGIHVTGREYDNWYLSGNSVKPEPVPNFGKDLEISALMELMDNSGEIVNQEIGLRIQGASTREQHPKRFALTAREEYSGSQVFDAEVFDGVSTHSIMLKASLPDAIVTDLVDDRAIATQRNIPVRVFLNGEFWYDSFMLERYDEQYFRQYYKVDDRVLVKSGILDEESAANAALDFYGEYMDWVKHTDFSNPHEWEQFQKETDVQSYIDYIITNYYFCNFDFSDDKNYVLWRSPGFTSDQFGDKRWRWCIFDIDAIEYALDNFNVENAAEINIFSCDLPFSDINVNETVLFRSLRQNPEFCQRFVLSFMDMLNNNFSISNVERVLKEYGYTLDWMDGFFKLRPAYATKHLAKEFDLTGFLETVTVTTKTPEMGSIIVNTSTIDLSGGSWSGQYFTDYPITVTAVPGDGYRFIGWKGGNTETANTVTLNVDGGIKIEAVFAEE